MPKTSKKKAATKETPEYPEIPENYKINFNDPEEEQLGGI